MFQKYFCVLYNNYSGNLSKLKGKHLRWRSLWLKLALCEMCPNTEFFLVRVFQHSDWIRRDTLYLSVFSLNAGKYGPEKTPYSDTFHAVWFSILLMKDAMHPGCNPMNFTKFSEILQKSRTEISQIFCKIHISVLLMGFVLQVYWKRMLYQCSLHEKCPYLELFWSAFSGIWTEYRKIRSISPYSIRMRENRTRITPNTDTFYAVVVVWDLSSFSDQWITQLKITKFSEDF